MIILLYLLTAIQIYGHALNQDQNLAKEKSPIISTRAEDQKPVNFVFFLVDDLGWTDLGCYGNDFIETPALDGLAASGMRFTAAYTASVCTPSRGQILSGQYNARTGLYKVPFKGNKRPWARVIPPEPWGDRPVNSEPLGSLLSKGGYESLIVGKVHVPAPFSAGMDGKSDPEKSQAVLGEQLQGEVNQFVEANPGKEVGPITGQAIEFIASNKDKPFFCYVGHHIPHIPLEAREEMINKYEAKWKKQPGKIHPHYAAMCEVMDESAALILKVLDELGLSDRTMVVFFSDNGGVNRCFYDAKGEQVTDLAPLRGEKGGIYEGGIRVPMIVRWPGKVKPNTECHTPVVSVDLLSTFMEIAGLKLPEEQLTDGVSLFPVLTGKGELEQREIFAYFPDYHHDFPGVTVRQGDYKLILSSEDGHLELYNLASDIGESINLAGSMPQKAKELHRILMDWQERLGAKSATPNPKYDPQREHLLDPDAEDVRLRYLPEPLPK